MSNSKLTDLVEQPDLNWEKPEVVKEVHDIMHFWLKLGVSGFRMDVINFISKEPGLPDADVVWPEKEYQPAYRWYAYGPRLNEYLKGMRGVLDVYDAFAVGEMPCVNKDEQVASVVAEDEKQLNEIFIFDIVDMDIGGNGKFSKKEWDANTLKTIVDRWQSFMAREQGWNASFMENHDQARSVSRFTKHRPEHRELAAKMLATFIGCQAGTLYVYQGQELGMTNMPESWGIEEYQDVETKNQYREFAEDFKDDDKKMALFMDEVHKKARDHARTPVQWSAEANGGFTMPEGQKPWMKVNDNYKEINAEKQQGHEKSVLSYWQKLLKVRKEYKDILVYGRFEMVQDGSEKVIAYKRDGGEALGSAWIVLNFLDEEVRWTPPASFKKALKAGKEVLGTYEGGVVIEGDDIVLRSFESRVVVVAGAA